MTRRRELDKPLLASTVVLVALGMLTLYSAGQTDVPSAAAEIWKRQLVWLGMGVVAAGIAFRVSPRMLEWVTPYLYWGALLLLLLTLIIGTGAGTAAGAKSWLTIAGIEIPHDY